MEEKKVLVVLGGTLTPEFLADFYNECSPGCVIAADGAMAQVLQAGIPCDYGVGDFDTVDQGVLEHFRKQPDIRLLVYPPQKDQTDAQLALELAMELEPSGIWVVGATGGRLDHLLGNLDLLRLPLERDIFCEIADPLNRICLVKHSMTLPRLENWKYVSFLSYTDRTEGICLRGFRYSLKNYTLEKGSTLCISNEIVDDRAEVTLRSGILYCIRSRDLVTG